MEPWTATLIGSLGFVLGALSSSVCRQRVHQKTQCEVPAAGIIEPSTEVLSPVERQQLEWVITMLLPVAQQASLLRAAGVTLHAHPRVLSRLLALGQTQKAAAIVACNMFVRPEPARKAPDGIRGSSSTPKKKGSPDAN